MGSLRKSAQAKQMEIQGVWTESVKHGATYCFAHCFPAVLFFGLVSVGFGRQQTVPCVLGKMACLPKALNARESASGGETDSSEWTHYAQDASHCCGVSSHNQTSFLTGKVLFSFVQFIQSLVFQYWKIANCALHQFIGGSCCTFCYWYHGSSHISSLLLQLSYDTRTCSCSFSSCRVKLS